MEREWAKRSSANELEFQPMTQKTTQPFVLDKSWSSTYVNYSTKFETMATIQNMEVAKLWNNDHAKYHRNVTVPE